MPDFVAAFAFGAVFLAAGGLALALTALTLRTGFLAGRFAFAFALRTAARFVVFTFDFHFFAFFAMTILPTAFVSLGRFGHQLRSLRSDLL